MTDLEEKTQPAEATFRAIGKPIVRKEDARLITGRGRFSDDFSLAGEAHAVMVRSPHPHARIHAIDAARAKAMPGVLGVFTGADCLADGLEPIPHDPLPKTRYDMKLAATGGGEVFIGPHWLLPTDKARHVGEAVAMVVAESVARALDAAEAVEVEYDVLPGVYHSEDAMQPGAPAVWDEVPNNVPVDTSFGDVAATDQAFAAAAHVVAMDFHVDRVTGVPLEPRAALGHYDAQSRRYTLHAGSGGAVRQKRELAAVLGIAPDRLRVLAYDVGGNFGTRNRIFVEFGLVLWASRKLGRPVKFTATRSEAFLSDYQGRDLVTRVALALAADGRFLAMRATNISNVGARCVSLSPLSKGAGLIPGSYAIPAAALRARAVYTNTMPTQAYRSSGRPEVTFAIERLIDVAAERLGIDRVELRRKNLIRPEAMPYRNAVGMRYDSGRYEENMNRAMEIADWKGFPQRRRAAAKRGRLRGRGLANYVESSIGAPNEQAHRRDRARPSARSDRIPRRPLSRPRQQPQLRFSRARGGGGAPRPSRGSRRRHRGGDRQRDARSGIPQRLRRLRGRGRPGDRRGAHHPLRLGRRRRPLHQSADRARPDPRRHRARDRPGDVGAMLCRAYVRPAADRLAHGLRPAARGYGAAVSDRDRRGALAHQPARHQGRRRRRHHRGARGRRQRDRRRAARLRRARPQDAGDALPDLAGDPGGQGGSKNRADVMLGHVSVR